MARMTWMLTYNDFRGSQLQLNGRRQDGLRNLILLSSCTNTLKAIGYLNKIKGPENMRKIIARLPPKLQSSWRDNADRILNADKREVCIEDIAPFVEERSRALSNPIFGKLPFLAKDKKKSQRRGAKSKPEGSGPGPRELSNFSTFISEECHGSKQVSREDVWRSLENELFVLPSDP